MIGASPVDYVLQIPTAISLGMALAFLGYEALTLVRARPTGPMRRMHTALLFVAMTFSAGAVLSLLAIQHAPPDGQFVAQTRNVFSIIAVLYILRYAPKDMHGKEPE